ncbi:MULTISPECIES: hypothetical protein [unclassified Haloferax]|uniref:hypothetical protein n=1 Tax=unclassified Haloferax TaxID=2625095 RepID=UPI000E247C7E|nr:MULTISPECIES: hypothetical protein [unclassified Haloferax]RDZ33764.1 hypothetical protein C5B88_18425 [Haloferax sp. Atlit-24N]RLM34286.1 hypothetical protein DVK03_17205 [Haloferax sp. Atlit-109R]RLM41106.1 hypothetical protein DVK04_17020 [Haloferax sp. Atlit-105R]
MKRRTFVTASTLSVAGLSGCLGDTEYRIADTAVETPLEGLSLSVDLAVADATIEHPAALTLSLENTADDPIRIRSYGVWPFGVLALAPSLTPSEDTWKTTLFSPSYEASTRVEVGRGGSSLSLDGTPITRPLDAGESVSRRYELRGDDLSGSGTQYVVDRFERKASRYATGDDWNALDYRLRLSIDEKRRFPF